MWPRRRAAQAGPVAPHPEPHAEYDDPRLVPLYDRMNRWGRDDDFFLALANETPQARILDLGCGTGRLTLALAGAGHEATGLDPAQASLDWARGKPGAGRVRWRIGTAADAPAAAFDLVLMTSHVAQVFTSAPAWQGVLREIYRALRPGGRLAFDSRDPAARAWEVWDSGGERRRFTLPGGEEVEVWTTLRGVTPGETEADDEGPLVTFDGHFLFPATGETVLDTSHLRFRPEARLRATLEAAGFGVEHVFGGWQREEAGQRRTGRGGARPLRRRQPATR